MKNIIILFTIVTFVFGQFGLLGNIIHPEFRDSFYTSCEVTIPKRPCSKTCPEHYECKNKLCCPIISKRNGGLYSRATYITKTKCHKHIPLKYENEGEFCSLDGFKGHMGEFNFHGKPNQVTSQQCFTTDDCNKEVQNPGVCVNENEKRRNCYYSPTRDVKSMEQPYFFQLWLFFSLLSIVFGSFTLCTVSIHRAFFKKPPTSLDETKKELKAE